MGRSQADSSRPIKLPVLISANHCVQSSSGFLPSLLLGMVFVFPSGVQDTGTAATEFHGNGVAIDVVVHGPSGQPIASPVVVKLFHDTIPAGQAATTAGRAELVVNEVGDFTVVVQAGGYANAQKDFSINSAGRAQV